MNTRITYLYRDASNYKMWNFCIIHGEISEEQIGTIIGCLEEGELFIPRQVGLPENRFAEVNSDDHCWFELGKYSFEKTEDEANVGLTASELVENFVMASGAWKEYEVKNEEEGK